MLLRRTFLTILLLTAVTILAASSFSGCGAPAPAASPGSQPATSPLTSRSETSPTPALSSLATTTTPNVASQASPSPSPLPSPPSSSSSEPRFTVLTSAEGNVLVMKSGTSDWVKGVPGMKLELNDRIKSDSSGTATITFFDGSAIDIKPMTEIGLAALESKGGDVTAVKVKQQIGDTISRAKKLLDSQSRYEIETQAGVAAVRGTIMFVAVLPDGTTTVKNIEGLVSFIAQGKEVVIPEGQSSTASPGQPPSSPTAPEMLPITVAISNLVKNGDTRPEPAVGDVDWWYYDISMRNDNSFGVVLLNHQKSYQTSDNSWSDPVKNDISAVFQTTYLGPGATIVYRHNWVWFARKSEAYPALTTEVFFCKDDFGRELQVQYRLTVNVN
jgi:hypothetical protein